MKDKLLEKLNYQISPKEVMAVVTKPSIISLITSVNEVIHDRLPNPFISDTSQRMTTDTSQKVRIRYGKIMKAYLKISINRNSFSNCWMVSINDEEKAFKISSDPMCNELYEIFKDIKIVDPETFHG